MKFGTENIKALLDFGFTAAVKVKQVTAEDSPGGKKVVITEILGSIGLLTKIPGLIRSGKEAFQEWLDLRPEEKTELEAFFKSKFNIANTKIEKAVEAAWGIVLAIGDLISVLDGGEDGPPPE